MTNSQRLQLIRQKITQWLVDQGHTVTEHPAESILVREGFYCGRRFKLDHITAIWFTEDDQVKIYDGNNNLLASFKGVEEPSFAARRAA